MASANGVTGWTPAPFTDVVPVAYQDNADQTNFWADFIASSNTLGAQAEQLVSTGSAQEISAFIQTLQGWQQNVQNFDAAQGGVFQARFDNELLGKDSTVGADVAAMIKGLENSRRGAGQGRGGRLPCQRRGCLRQQCPAQRRHVQHGWHDRCGCTLDRNRSAASSTGLAVDACDGGRSTGGTWYTGGVW